MPETHMDLLMVTDRWDDEGGGRERYLSELRASLTRRGWSIAVITNTELGERRLQHAIGGFRASHPNSPVLTARPAIGATHYQLHSGVYAAAYAAEREAYDSTLRRLCFWPAMRLNMRRRRLLRMEERMFDGNSRERFMTFSDQSRDELRKLFGVANDRVTVRRPGVELSIFRPNAASDTVAFSGRGQVRMLFAGHNFVLKGLRWALEALAQARRHGTDARLIVAGRGSTSSFSAMARRLNIEKQIRFAGVVSRDALARLYRDSDLLIHPTFYDPFPRVIVEALASGVPVVTTRVCGGAELITPGRNGFVVDDPRQVEQLTAAIVSIADPERRIVMGAAAAETGRGFAFETHADDVARWLSAT